MLARAERRVGQRESASELHRPPVVAPSVPAPGTRPQARRSLTSASPGERAFRTGFIVACILALGLGWRIAVRGDFVPKEGFGYWIGIVGGSMLLFQLAYPLRKRVRFMRRAGSAPTWFRLHMILGIVGPILILYHCNFSLGATNSNVALFTMLIVVASGIVGRYFYGKVHRGLHGVRTNLGDLLADAAAMLREVESDVGGASGSIAARLTAFAERAMRPRATLAGNFATALWLGISVPFARRRILLASRAAIAANARRRNWSRGERRLHYQLARQHIGGFLDAVVAASELTFYERLLALWHVLHMPLFLLLVVTGLVHVVAVHLY
jgi:hypothetical protein